MPEPQLPPQPGSPPEAPMPRSDSTAPVRVKRAPAMRLRHRQGTVSVCGLPVALLAR